MNTVTRAIFRAIHEGRWLSVEYANMQGKVTHYWIAVVNLNPLKRTLTVDGMHLSYLTVQRLDVIYIDRITEATVVEGSWCERNEELIRDIHSAPEKYRSLMGFSANLQVLDYLEACSRLDGSPYQKNFDYLPFLDDDILREHESFELSEPQFRKIVAAFQADSDKRGKRKGGLFIKHLVLNALSIHTPKGLYVLACRELNLDVKGRCLKPDEAITVCTQFTVNGTVVSASRYLDAEEMNLLDDFAAHAEEIKDAIRGRGYGSQIDDNPYVIGLEWDAGIDLASEYEAVEKSVEEGTAPTPIMAFFGEYLERPRARKSLPVVMPDGRANLDQLAAVDHAVRYPLSYVQGPPGTGKTSTIIGLLLTAFCGGRTVLFASSNNHPIDSALEKLQTMQYEGKTIPFPVLRLGNREKLEDAMRVIAAFAERAQTIEIPPDALSLEKGAKKEQRDKLAELLGIYRARVELEERGEALDRMKEYSDDHTVAMQMLPFLADIEGRQMQEVKDRLARLPVPTEEEAQALLADEAGELPRYLYYRSFSLLKKLNGNSFKDLRDILATESRDTRMIDFRAWLKKSENVTRLTKVFPVIATTCMSAHRLGEPKAIFDMTVIDEASQCGVAYGLLPVIRGRTLTLVGDPQQLSPVVLLDERTNKVLRQRYAVSSEYDYRSSSLYKTFLACDAVSDEVLLRSHYRCHPDIIGFNNKKYYGSQLVVRSEKAEKPDPLVFVNVPAVSGRQKNTAPQEVAAVVSLAAQAAKENRSVGVITPFVNQKEMLSEQLRAAGLADVSCGTVHAFQGDEKDVVIFSTAITDKTRAGTYAWLKDNRELINVATSRPRQQLVVLGSGECIEKLHKAEPGGDDLFDLVKYVKSRGKSEVAERTTNSRALGVKPFSTKTEEAFLQTLTHALENLWLSETRFTVEKEVSVSQVFADNPSGLDLFYTGRFDFVVYEQDGERKFPVLVIELDGREHEESDIVAARDAKKQKICEDHGMQLIRVENSYARRYHYIKNILERYFRVRH